MRLSIEQPHSSPVIFDEGPYNRQSEPKSAVLVNRSSRMTTHERLKYSFLLLCRNSRSIVDYVDLQAIN